MIAMIAMMAWLRRRWRQKRCQHEYGAISWVFINMGMGKMWWQTCRHCGHVNTWFIGGRGGPK